MRDYLGSYIYLFFLSFMNVSCIILHILAMFLIHVALQLLLSCSLYGSHVNYAKRAKNLIFNFLSSFLWNLLWVELGLLNEKRNDFRCLK